MSHCCTSRFVPIGPCGPSLPPFVFALVCATGADYCHRESPSNDMVYTQARLDEALLVFREGKRYFKRRGLETNNLESHLGRKYELRKPPPAVAFRPKPSLWAGRDDNDSDEEFEPSSSRKKKKKNAVSESKPVRLHKRKLSISGDESGTSKHKRRNKGKGTTWAQGRRLGRSQKVTFKFSKSENLRVLRELCNLHGPGAMIPLEEHVNVFNANSLDSGFIPSSSDTVIDPILGLATPRHSIDSIEPLQAFTDFAGLGQEPTRDLRNRSVKLDSPTVKKRQSCITCLDQAEHCSLLDAHPDYIGACDVCLEGGSDCKIYDDDKPRMGLATSTEEPTENLHDCVVSFANSCTMCIEMGEECSLLTSPPDYTGQCYVCEMGDTPCRIKEDDEPRKSTRDLHNRAVADSLQTPTFPKRYSCLTCLEQGVRCSLLFSSQYYLGPCDVCEESECDCKINENDEPRMGPLTRMLAGGGIKRSIEVDEDDDEPEDADRCGKRTRFGNGNIGSIFTYEEESSPGIGNSMLKKKAIERDNITLINALNGTTNTGSVGGGMQYLDTNLANNVHNFSNVPDSGYHTSGFPNLSTSKCFDINMGNTLDTAIVLPDSAPPSPPSLFLPEETPSALPHFEPDHTESITTSWAQPIDFQHQPKQTGLPCHFCDDYRYGFLGLGRLRVEVVWDHTAKHYIEVAGGHVGKGREPTRMCTACSFERLRIRFCGHGHDVEGKEKNNMHNHQLVEVPSWRAVARTWTGKNNWTSQLKMTRSSPEYSTQAPLAPCHLCCLPAMYRCCTVQERNRALQPLTEMDEGKEGCGLRVCEKCKTDIEDAGGMWTEEEVLGAYRRADAEFLFPGSLLERGWEAYLGSVGLVL
jgi:hypothetical protein